MKRIALLLTLALVAAACAVVSDGGDIEGAWQLESGTFDDEPIPILDSHPITMTLDGDQISGTAACNGYGGTYQISDGVFSTTELAWTEMACFPQEVMDSEQAFLQALLDVESADVVDGNLVLTGSRTEMTFTELESVPTSELTGTVWVLDGMIQGDVVSSVAGERATLELFTDGSFIGSTGCRTIAGSYIVSGAEVVFTDFGADGECSADLADQDSRVISALEGGFRVEIDGNTLTTWAAGDEGLVYRADS